MKRQVLTDGTQWQGSTETWEEISDEEAAVWLSKNDHEPPEACAEKFAALEIK